ncbi:Phosphomannomutase 1 [Psilocybe cubensis]|uniref:Phosphomannomutase 1 n=2 Tax=Psilocybe cubensis TaxID=181762 RepID=A0ACB8GVZ4_PSICU|nr:Phosphomannomutase 1 [Psilocybe cubensis]KAH9479639.1 Phosphomannomutase 1 [Psilocybe cubensis]
MVSDAFAHKPLKKLYLFDVDNTLTPARHPRSLTPELQQTLCALREKVAIGFLGGSDFTKITEQLQTGDEVVLDQFDYGFAENGLIAYKLGKQLPSQSFIEFIGEERYQLMVNFILHYIADLDIPIKRGTFVEFRRGMINVSPIGRNASLQERKDFEILDNKKGYRKAMIEALKTKFPDYGLTYSIGGQLSFDIFPIGWDKTFALSHVEDENFEEIHFFGDKTHKASFVGFSSVALSEIDHLCLLEGRE